MAKFALMVETGSDLTLSYEDGSTAIVPNAALQDFLESVTGTDRARELRIPSASVVRILTPGGVVALNAAIARPVAIASPPHGWRPGLDFGASSTLDAIPLALRMKPNRLEAEDDALNAWQDALMAGAWSGLPAQGLLRKLGLGRFGTG